MIYTCSSLFQVVIWLTSFFVFAFLFILTIVATKIPLRHLQSFALLRQFALAYQYFDLILIFNFQFTDIELNCYFDINNHQFSSFSCLACSYFMLIHSSHLNYYIKVHNMTFSLNFCQIYFWHLIFVQFDQTINVNFYS